MKRSHIAEPEQGFVYGIAISAGTVKSCSLGIRYLAFEFTQTGGDQHLLPCQSVKTGLKQMQITPNAGIVLQYIPQKAPFGRSGFGIQADTAGDIPLFPIPFELDKQIRRAFRPGIRLITDQIIPDRPRRPAARIEAAGSCVAVQHHRHQCLHRDRLARPVLPAQHHLAVFEEILLIIIIPVAENTGPVHLPLSAHTATLPVSGAMTPIFLMNGCSK